MKKLLSFFVWLIYSFTISAQINSNQPKSLSRLDLISVNVSHSSSQMACSITSSQFAVSSCQPNNTYNVTGTVTLTTPPISGSIIIKDSCSNVDTIITAPFPSTINYSFIGLPTSSLGGNSSITAYFLNDTACRLTIPYAKVHSCNCVANIGTFTVTTPNTSSQNPYKLCFGDQLTITSNGGFIPPDSAGNPPINPPNGYRPGIGYLVYSCPPTIALVPSTVFPNNSISNDPCLVGILGFGNSFTDINSLGQPNFAGL